MIGGGSRRCASGVGLREFKCFDRVFSEGSSQASVYEYAAREQVHRPVTYLMTLQLPPSMSTFKHHLLTDLD